MKRNLLICTTLFLTVLLPPARGDSRSGFGVGVMLGEPTGLSLKQWRDQNRAWAAGLAWSFADNPSLHFHMDTLSHTGTPFQTRRRTAIQENPVFYYGIGGRIKLESGSDNRRNANDSLLGIRVPLGLSYDLRDLPVDLFVEIVPILDVVPRTDLSLNAAVGIRYFF